MSAMPTGELPANAINYIRGGRIVIVATVDASGRPNSAPFSWIVAKDSQTLRLGIGLGQATLENIRHSGFVSCSITAPELHLSFRGPARVIREAIPEIPIPTAVVEITVEEVKDDALIGPIDGEAKNIHWTQRRRLISDSTIVQALLDA